ncbi:FtsH protease activity modulator HflK [Halobacillus litoralis]|uniref:Protein HflK n=1 Tax=Halobacillus litoralis TaxID=45668 RepID=A0A845E2W9_9BACI|nr:FtsH protease activity modulator HflK [Halobacillus litoralis]MYL20014.1 FtsH protease activity modulator HflK [Halobacillus litoralis]MYL38996.1 FtsH protease activity modulator HflK [Halobacillus litoralis]
MSLKQIYKWAGLVAAAAVLLVVFMTTWYTVDESEQAVVLTFGEAEDGITEPGLHFKMPWPVQEVEKMSKETFSLDFGFDEEGEEADKVTMITGDDMIVQADLVVQWKITDPAGYLFASENPEQVLFNATSSTLRGVIGSSEIDEALTSGKAEIENEVREDLVSLIEGYEIGISIIDVRLQEVDLPNEEVRSAFTKVTDAREQKQSKVNEAEKYANQMREEAKGEKDAIIQRAEGDKVDRVRTAEGAVSKFDALLDEYEGNESVTRERLVMETLEEVLPEADVYVMNDEGDTMKYLPLQQQNPPAAPAQEESEEEEES